MRLLSIAMKDQINQPRRKTGRPLSFDRDAALEQAMLLFWRYGYEGASLSDLTGVMGIAAPSLYTAFGNKQRLFLDAVDRYMTRPGCDVRVMLQEAPTAYEAVRRVLRTASVAQTNPDGPHGCLLMSAATHSPSATEVKKALSKLRRAVERWVKERIERGITEGELPAHTDAAALAGFYLAVLQGMSTQARDGGTRYKLRAIADAAMFAWPTA